MSTLLLRYLESFVLKDLGKKMVFIGGPRQVGKTTFCQNFIQNYRDDHPAYLTWDRKDHRKQILNLDWSRSEPIVIFDELHKYSRWRNHLKGIYDTLKNTQRFLVTGSARLDHYRRGGDSLMGRYYYYRMHPLTLPEIDFTKNGLNDLLTWGGFPEPYFEKNEDFLNRWHQQRIQRLVREDIRDLESIRDVSLIELLAEALPSRVGSPLSVRNLALDLEIDPKTCKRWIEILGSLYYCYQIAPFGIPRLKTVKHEKKLYLWDWSQVSNDGGFRFENLVASHLLKFCHFQEDTKGIPTELRFIRDVEKREIDFVVLQNKKPIFAVESKTGERNLSPAIGYYSQRSKIPKFYQVHLGTRQHTVSEKIEILPFESFCKKEKLL